MPMVHSLMKIPSELLTSIRESIKWTSKMDMHFDSTFYVDKMDLSKHTMTEHNDIPRISAAGNG